MSAGGRENCTATYGEVKCWRERGHKPTIHHGTGDVWWQPGDAPPGVRVARVQLAAHALLQQMQGLGESERVAVSDLARDSTRGNVDASRLEDALRAISGPLEQ